MRDGVKAVTFLLSQPPLRISETFQRKRQPGCSLPVCAQTHHPRHGRSLHRLQSESCSREGSAINAEE